MSQDGSPTKSGFSKPGHAKRYVPTGRVRPLVLWLEGSYGGLGQAARETGIPIRTLQVIKQGRNHYVTKPVAKRVVDAVMALKRGDRTWSTFENEGHPRRATVEEEHHANHRPRWSFLKVPVSKLG